MTIDEPIVTPTTFDDTIKPIESTTTLATPDPQIFKSANEHDNDKLAIIIGVTGIAGISYMLYDVLT